MSNELEKPIEAAESSISNDARNILVVTGFFILVDGLAGGFSGFWVGSNLWVIAISYLLVKKFGADKGKSLPPFIFSGLSFLVTLALAFDAINEVPAHPHEAKYIIGQILIGGGLFIMSFMLSRKIKGGLPTLR